MTIFFWIIENKEEIKEKSAKENDNFFVKNCRFLLEAPPRFELGHKAFAELCLTTWLWRRIMFVYTIVYDKRRRSVRLLSYGAEDEIRTRDVHLGKVTLYH